MYQNCWMIVHLAAMSRTARRENIVRLMNIIISFVDAIKKY